MRPNLVRPSDEDSQLLSAPFIHSRSPPQGSGSDAEAGGDSGDDSDAGEDFTPMDADGEEAPPKKKKAAKKGRLKRDSQPGKPRVPTHRLINPQCLDPLHTALRALVSQ